MSTYYVAMDIEALGSDTQKYPVVAVAFVVVNRMAQVVHKWQIYMPYNVCEDTIEPLCYREFWNNPKKCSPQVFAHLIEQCRTSPFESLQTAWQAVAKQIDYIYDRFGSKDQDLVKWVTDCADYDVALISDHIKTYAGRVGLRYNRANKRHSVQDYKSGLYVISRLFPKVAAEFEQTVTKAGAPEHTHDCLDDATRMAIKFVKFLDTVDRLENCCRVIFP